MNDVKKESPNVTRPEGKTVDLNPANSAVPPKPTMPELRFMPKEDLIKLASYLFEQNKEIIGLYLNVINAINKNMVQVVDNNDKP